MFLRNNIVCDAANTGTQNGVQTIDVNKNMTKETSTENTIHKDTNTQNIINDATALLDMKHQMERDLSTRDLRDCGSICDLKNDNNEMSNAKHTRKKQIKSPKLNEELVLSHLRSRRRLPMKKTHPTQKIDKRRTRYRQN